MDNHHRSTYKIFVPKTDSFCLNDLFAAIFSSVRHHLLMNGIVKVNPSKNKRGGVCIYYKSFLLLRILNIQYLQESISFELKIDDETCNFISLYGSPSQSLELKH